MNTLRSLVTICFFAFATCIFAQPTDLVGNLNFTVKKLADQSYGVFVQPDETIAPSTRTTTGSGQVTLVAPINFTYANLEYYGGTWVENARVNGPIEAADKAYISFGFVTDNPKINLYPAEETLLFTFTTSEEFDGTFSLFENGNDAFAVPNSYGSNPGNDLGLIDFGVAGGMQYYTYAGNYGQTAPTAVLATDKEPSRSNDRVKAVFTSDSNEERLTANKPK